MIDLESSLTCLKTCLQILKLFPIHILIGIIIIPIISAYLNLYVHYLLEEEKNNIFKCICFITVFDIISNIIQNNLLYQQVGHLSEILRLRIYSANLYCSVPLPGKNQKQYKDLLDDHYKVRDFIFIVPLIWSSIVRFGISIRNMKTNSTYPIRMFFTIFCIGMCGLLTNFTDQSLYEKAKPNPSTIINLTDSRNVKIKVSLGGSIDKNYFIRKRLQIESQDNWQKYIILFVNLVFSYISIKSENISQYHAFTNISWLIAHLADNIKSLKYYTFIQEFIMFCECLESYQIKGISIDKIDSDDIIKSIRSVTFKNTTFGYYTPDLTNNPEYIKKIINFSYQFNQGIFYYLEAPNGIGKSTLLKMFVSELMEGDIYFNSTNRNKLSWDFINRMVYHMVQASEYTPTFTKEEINISKGKDPWLENKLGLNELFDKSSVEMSGGQKKRMFLYMCLVSSAQIILLDEILSELSTEPTNEVPEGGGWLTRVINTLVKWKGLEQKIIILVGHGLIDLIPNNNNITKLKLFNNENQTLLDLR